MVLPLPARLRFSHSDHAGRAAASGGWHSAADWVRRLALADRERHDTSCCNHLIVFQRRAIDASTRISASTDSIVTEIASFLDNHKIAMIHLGLSYYFERCLAFSSSES
jgi:hypothetical protein